MALYDLNNPIDKQKAISKMKNALEKKCVIELKEKRNRTLRQNSYLYLILTWFGLEYGCSTGFAKHEYFKKEVNIDIFAIRNKQGNLIDLKSTKDLDTVEMTTAIDKFRNWSGQEGIYLPSPDEKEFLKEIELQESRNRY